MAAWINLSYVDGRKVVTQGFTDREYIRYQIALASVAANIADSVPLAVFVV
jgi:hypothetical protein